MNGRTDLHRCCSLSEEGKLITFASECQPSFHLTFLHRLSFSAERFVYDIAPMHALAANERWFAGEVGEIPRETPKNSEGWCNEVGLPRLLKTRTETQRHKDPRKIGPNRVGELPCGCLVTWCLCGRPFFGSLLSRKACIRLSSVREG